MRRRDKVLSWGLGLVLLAGTDAAWAQTPTETEDALIREGLARRAEGHDAEALPLLLRAWEASHSPRATAQLGMVEQALGRWADADRHLREALRAADDPWVIRSRPVLEQALTVIAQHVGRLELIGVEGARVRVDGRDAGTLPLAEPLTVPPGRVLVEVEAEGYHPLTREVVISAGGNARESLDMVRVPPPPPPPPPVVIAPPVLTPRRTSAPASRRGWRAWSYAGFGVGGALTVAGAVSLVVWQSNVARFNDSMRCGQVDGAVVGGQDCEAWLRDGSLLRTLGIVGLAVGGATLVASTVVFVLSGPSRPRAERVWACAPGLLAPTIECAWRF